MTIKIRRVGGAQAQMAREKLGLVKIDRGSAKRLFGAGVPIVMVGSNVNAHHFFGGWHLAYRADPGHDRSFDVIANAFSFHLEPELGRRPAFFVMGESLKRVMGASGPHGTGHRSASRMRTRARIR